MMKTCAVKGCFSRVGGSRIFFRFPDSEAILQRWVEFCKDESLTKLHRRRMKKWVCDLHFKPEDFQPYYPIRRKNLTVPSLNGPSLEIAGSPVSVEVPSASQRTVETSTHFEVCSGVATLKKRKRIRKKTLHHCQESREVNLQEMQFDVHDSVKVEHDIKDSTFNALIMKDEFIAGDSDIPNMIKKEVVDEQDTTLSDVNVVIKEEHISDGSESVVTDIYSGITEKVFLNEPDHGLYLDECSSDAASAFEKKDNVNEESSCEKLRQITAHDSVADCETGASQSLPLPQQYTGKEDTEKCQEYSGPFALESCNSGQKIIHSGTKSFQCDVCDKSFTRGYDLARHKLIHSGVKKFLCDVCNRAFTRSGDLPKHKLIHSGVKKFYCAECNKSFSQSSNLIQHSKSKHGGIRRYQCDMCNKTFTQECDFATHKLRHSNVKRYQCDECEKTSTRLSDLQKHKYTHSGIKNYVCPECGKAFIQSSHLSRHKLIHLGIKKYQYPSKKRKLNRSVKKR